MRTTYVDGSRASRDEGSLHRVVWIGMSEPSGQAESDFRPYSVAQELRDESEAHRHGYRFRAPLHAEGAVDRPEFCLCRGLAHG